VIDRYVTRIIVRRDTIDIELREPTAAPAPSLASDASVTAGAAASSASTTVINLPWSAPSFHSVKGVLRQPETKPTLKQETRDAILLAIASELECELLHTSGEKKKPRRTGAKISSSWRLCETTYPAAAAVRRPAPKAQTVKETGADITSDAKQSGRLDRASPVRPSPADHLRLRSSPVREAADRIGPHLLG
jgi:hypothetical protein